MATRKIKRMKRSESGRQRALIADLPNGVSLFKDTSGPRMDGTRADKYRIRLGKKFTGGKPYSHIVKNLQEAREWIKDVAPFRGVMATTQLSPTQIAEVIVAYELLKSKESTLGLQDAVELALCYHDPEGGRRTIAEVAEEMVRRSTKRKAQESTLGQLRSLLKGISDQFGTRLLPTLGTTEIEDWLEDAEWAARTRNNYLSQLNQLYGFALKRRYVNLNPCDPIDPALQDNSPPGILSPEEVHALLKTAKARFPEMINFVAIGAFGWIRRSEICRLERQAWQKETGIIHVAGLIAKTKKNRYVTVNDTLKAWLDVAPGRDAVYFTSSRNADVMGERLRRLAKMAKVQIPHNGLRHSAISYALAFAPTVQGCPMDYGVGAIAKQAGNSESVITSSYRALVVPSEGKKYWGILP